MKTLGIGVATGLDTDTDPDADTDGWRLQPSIHAVLDGSGQMY